MVKKRIIPKFLVRGGRLVKAIQFFNNFREAGNAVSTARIYDSYGVDEMIFLDIDATSEKRNIDRSIIEKVSEEIFMPFTVGGGVRSISDIESLLESGADKVSINSAALEIPGFVSEAASRFGDQCILVSIDYRADSDGTFVYSRGGSKRSYMAPADWAMRMENEGAGEIMMTSIARDGMMNGYDLDMINNLASRLTKPLIASSGAGNLSHCHAALDAGASAVTVSSMFIFTDNSPIKVRTYLAGKGVNVRNQIGSHS
jgi:imidazole glycerol-phosphate synthase subunit HisF